MTTDPAPTRPPEGFEENGAASGRFFESLFHQPRFPKVIVSLESTVIRANRAMCNLLGYTADELRGMSIRRFTHPEDVDVDAAQQRALIEGRARFFQREKRYIRKSGTVFWGQLSVTLVLDDHGAPHCFIGEVTDITERLRTEQELRESESRLRQIAESIQEVFWMADAETGDVIYVSPAYEKTWGRTCASLYADPPSWLAGVHEEDRARVRESSRTSRRTGTYDVTYRVVRPDRSVRWVHDRAFPVHDAQGRVVRIVGTAVDVTERRELEDLLRQAQKLEAVGQLAGGVAHDFNNLLAAMMMHLELVIGSGTVAGEAADDLEQVKLCAERAANLTRQLLMFSRRQVMRPRDLDLNEAVRSILKLVRRTLTESIELRTSLHALALPVHADAGMLDQVLLNLIVNARDAMPRGGALLLETACEELSVEDAGRRPDATPGAYARLRVKDTGTGIAPEDLPRIFEPFFTTKEAGKGTGLGLATVFGVAKQHGGFVRVDTKLGGGATFDLLLPLKPTVDQRLDLTSSSTSGPRGNATVLLVEDDPHVLRVARAVLTRAGYRVLDARDGPQAIDVFEAHAAQIDVMVTDMVMPHRMDGLDLTARLREVRPDLPVLIVSGHSSEIAGRPLKLPERARFLEKPFDARQLLNAVRETLA